MEHGEPDGWSDAACQLLEARYLLRDDRGAVVETVDGLFWRVARAVAAADGAFPGGRDEAATAAHFHDAMVRRRFLPNSPTLMSAGTARGQLLACFVLPVPDSLDGIFTALHDAALIQQGGGGTGFSFSALRPRGDLVRSTHRPSSGPVPFLRLFDQMNAVIAGESLRGGANMATLRVDHPDVRAFAAAKLVSEQLPHFNLAIAVPDAFMDAVARAVPSPLVNPRTGATVGALDAGALLDELAEHAWATGDPGLLFLDRIARDNPLPALGPLEATNPCGEVPLLPHEACCLGSLNLAAFLIERDGHITLDEAGLAETAALAIHFLDNVVEATYYPLPEIQKVCLANRKVGLGAMGFADLLLALGIPYGSQASVRVADRIFDLIGRVAVAASRQLAEKRGPFPNFGRSRYAAAGEPPRRNATVTAVAPTGSLSLLAGCSSGIEPLYALAYRHTGAFGRTFPLHPRAATALAQLDRAHPGLLADVEARGRIGQCTDLPAAFRQLFRVAAEIPPSEHLAVQAAVQRRVENAVSKTVNLAADATVDTVRATFVEAHRRGCKGVTVYREGTQAGQVLQVLGRCLSCVGEETFPPEHASVPGGADALP